MPYDFDPTGSLPANLVVDELHTITEINANTYNIIIPEFAPFYTNNLSVVYNDGINGVVMQAALMSPSVPVYDFDGNYAGPETVNGSSFND